MDQAILSEEERLVVIRFGRDHDPDCEQPPLLPWALFVTRLDMVVECYMDA